MERSIDVDGHIKSWWKHYFENFVNDGWHSF
jgi:hypothetical protein